MPKLITPCAIRYIKLGRHGTWEAECIRRGIIRLGFGTEKPSRYQLSQNRKWEKLTESFVKDGDVLNHAAKFSNEVRHFFEDDGSTLWITFYEGLLFWGFLAAKSQPKKHQDGVGVWRTVVNGWESRDVNGNSLKQSSLSQKLTRLAKYKGTSCKPSCADYVLQRINCGHEVTPAAPKANDVSKPPPVCQATINRIIRDTKLAKLVKAIHNYKCQICGHTIELLDGSPYAEAHHIRPLGKPHKGFDAMDNIVCVCPNHHAELDYGARPLSAKDLCTVPGHSINEEYICYHNENVCSPGTK